MPVEDALVVAGFQFNDGQSLAEIPIGYRTWGMLNPAADNAILVCHGFPSSSDLESWWACMIGPGKVLDTDRFFIVCVSAFSNLEVSENVRSFGPTSIDPKTGHPFGKSFPRLHLQDLIRAQDAVLRHLGIDRLALAIGPSMGAAQVLTRATLAPQTTAAVAAVLPFCGNDTAAELAIRAWAAGLQDTKSPAALLRAFLAVALDAVGWDAMKTQFKNGSEAIAALTALSETRAANSDVSHFLTLCDALARAALCDPPPGANLPPILLAPASSDKLFPPSVAEDLQDRLTGMGFDVDLKVIRTARGHIGGLTEDVLQIAPDIKALMDQV